MHRTIFRPKNNWFLSAISISWALLLGYFGVGYESGSSQVITLGIALAIIAVTYAIFIRPKLELSTDGIRIVNPLRTMDLNWNEIVEIEARYTLRFITAAGKFSVWAAPVGGAPRFGSNGIRRTKHREIRIDELKGTGFDRANSIPSSHSPDTDSGAALIAARRYLQEFRGRES
jgi:hypothetical protein